MPVRKYIQLMEDKSVAEILEILLDRIEKLEEQNAKLRAAVQGLRDSG